jgi:hypothetical protein
MPSEPIRALKSEPPETHNLTVTYDELIFVPKVLPDIDGTDIVTEYLAHDVESVTLPPIMLTEVDGLPPPPKDCASSTETEGVPLFAFAQNETVAVCPAKFLTSSTVVLNREIAFAAV